jgi:two-component system, LytTR family, sensor kinase
MQRSTFAIHNKGQIAFYSRDWILKCKPSTLALITTNGNKQKLQVQIMAPVWCMFWVPVHIVILLRAGFTPAEAVADALLSTLLLIFLSVFVVRNMRYYLPKKQKYPYVLVMSAALSGLWMLVTQLTLGAIFKSDATYISFLKSSVAIRFTIASLMIACNILTGLLWYSQKEQQKENERRADTEKLARDAELNKLRQQLQPHFLFNSLNSISALTGQQPEKARHMIQQLSDFLRGTLRNEEQQWISLADEITYLQLYLDIEKVRFGYRLQSAIDCSDEAMQLRLPAMLLQPLVENAIKFGLYDTIGEVKISITAGAKDAMLQVVVQNPYDEATAMPVTGTGFGLASVQRRLFLLFGRPDLLQIKKENDLFTATLHIPQMV